MRNRYKVARTSRSERREKIIILNSTKPFVKSNVLAHLTLLLWLSFVSRRSLREVRAT